MPITMDQVDTYDLTDSEPSHYDVIHEGPCATVTKTWVKRKNGSHGWIAMKSATTNRNFSKEPHDIVKECRLMSSMSHCHLVSVIGSTRDDVEKTFHIFMEYLPISLTDLLASPLFSPFPFLPHQHQDPTEETKAVESFEKIVKSLMVQILSATAFLHGHRIAHRDLKPDNVLLTTAGCIKLIDFGIAFKDNEQEAEKERDIWPEYRGRQYFEVSTGAYRAPELLFGTRQYDPFAIDLWSIGATFAEFFTSLRLSSDDPDDGDDEADDNEGEVVKPFVVPRYLRIGYPGSQWKRDTFFNGERGEIGLAWSIFKIFGTPTAETWPDFEDLPSAKSVTFNVVSRVPLAPLLPNLPNGDSSTDLLDFLSQLLKYPSASRLSASEALRHRWLSNSTILLPQGYDASNFYMPHLFQWDGKTLEDVLSPLLPNIPGR